ncbi:MAG: hypothetical protein UT42_C0008G0010 [Candidatus Falkowbacteria bacterium GW2011_GWA2_39_24]|uniref:IPT/TIG domain-containing protein n=1 Tax=Candidatus Falkowbacteria bacterium GW2011_GWA2_39_24 TaxID=1618634 RepID=A0A0G0QXY9_9BACT|nr:MAG: hypothetical protein UT42_C0008G0010 [Candidatus Falkowbacteria bacterium GW2011_GWA2_39_24]
MSKISKQLVIIFLLIFCSLAVYSLTPVIAQTQVDLWGDQISGQDFGAQQLEEVGLGKNDPRVIVINIIRIILGLLGVIAVALIMYGGWIWMTAQGNPESVDKAKLIIRNAVIGLLIILASFAIVTYILNRLTYATGATSASSCVTGATEQCKPGDCWRTCTNSIWGPCVGADCGVSGATADVACDSNTLLPGCQEDDNFCLAYNKYCDSGSCLCKSKSGYGDPCGDGQDQATCNKNSDQCANYLTCDFNATSSRCECSGPPVIDNVTPVGSFCDSAPNTYCQTNSDCSSGACNQGTPNGAVGNLVTIHGKNFLAYDPAVSQVLFWGGADYSQSASLAVTVNSSCLKSWTDTEIIVVVPNGAQTGGLKIVATNGSDVTSLAPGPNLPDFVVNNIQRPGLCQVAPISGPTDALITYTGLKLTGVTAYFGNLVKNVKANSSSFVSDLQGEVVVPNITPGRTSTFVQAGSQPNSNYLEFIKEVEATAVPMIVSISPITGPESQYVTITGSGFSTVRGKSIVYFGKEEANFSFPKVCANSVWNDNQIIVKVPKGLSDDELYDISVVVGTQTAISPTKFKYDKDLMLTPGLCLIYPMFGQHNDEMQLWGEYFGTTNTNNKVRFYLGQDQSGSAITYWDVDKSTLGTRPDKAITTIHQQAASGPVNIVKWDSKKNQELVSNDMYITIGQCQQDADCGAGVCCPDGTPEVGRCQTTPDRCFGSTESSVYEWEFSTGNDAQCPDSKPAQCSDGSCCSALKNCKDLTNSGQTTCTDDNSCSGYGSKMCYDSIYCPNSPGSCSQNSKIITYGGSCDCSLLGYLNTSFNNSI